MAKLIQAKLKGLTEKPGRHSDGQGLYLRSLGNGKSYWAYRYRSPDPEAKGRERELSIGPYPEITLVQARLRHAALRKAVVVDKVDPLAEKIAEKIAAKAAAALKPAKAAKPTFGEIADQYIKDHEPKWSNAVHRAQWRQTLGSPCAAIRDMPVDEVDTAAVLKVLKPIWTATPETASRLRARIEAVLASAQVDGLIDENRPNPARWKGWLALKLPNPREIGERGGHAAMPFRDVPAFVANLKATPGMAAKALTFAILTAARSGEVFGMTFDEIDFDYEVSIDEKRTAIVPAWLIGGPRMKMKTPHRVPLSPQAIDILADQIAARGLSQRYVFESPVPTGIEAKPLSSMALTMAMRRLGSGDYTPHGFRTSFHQWATEIARADLATVETCLAHKVGTKVTRAYDRSDRFVLRQPLMARWAEFIMGEMTNTTVLPLAGHR